MTNEKQLVDVSKENVKAVLEKYQYYPDEIWKFTAMTERFPTVDAVEVVRCRDCIMKDPPEAYGDLQCHILGIPMKDDDFCSYGERKDGDGNG